MGILNTIKQAVLGKPQDAPIKAAGMKRSPKWPAARDAYLKEHSACAVCGSKKDLNVHHKRPFHLHPSLELDPTNFITLCSEGSGHNCHLIFGHLGDFSSFNADVENDAANMSKKIAERPK